MLQSHRRAHARIAAGLFAGLGLQVGAWAVLIPHLVASRDLTPAALGAALAVMAATSIGALAAAGPLADRVGRRPLAVAGAAGFAASFVLLAAVEAPAALWPTLALYGVASGFLDLAANAVGSDYERAHGVRAMIRLHAGFSGAAAVGALLAGAVGPDTYWIVAAVYVALASPRRSRRCRRTRRRRVDPPAGAAHESSVAAGEAVAHETGAGRGGRLALLRIPAIAVAVGLVHAVLLRRRRDRGLCGAVPARRARVGRAADRRGARGVPRRVADGPAGVRAGGRAPASGSCSRWRVCWRAPRWPSWSPRARRRWPAAGLLVVGFALAPVVPTALSIAGRNAPGRSATAVSLVTTIGYGAFVLGPPAVGLLAGATSLRTALIPVVVSTAMIAVLARRVRVNRVRRQLVFGYGSLPGGGGGSRVPPARPPLAAGAWRWTTARRSPATRSTSTPRPASGRRSRSPT